MDAVTALLDAGLEVGAEGVIGAATNAYVQVLERVLDADGHQTVSISSESLAKAVRACKEQAGKPFNKTRQERYTQCLGLLGEAIRRSPASAEPI